MLFNFDIAKGKKGFVTVHVTAKDFKAAVTKFLKAYPKAKVNNVWASKRENTPIILK